MARRVYFSFHYEDIWKVNQIRNSHIVEGCTAAGFMDASLWERVRRRGDAAIKRAIDQGLENTSVTCVLIGTKTWERKYVRYEIEESIARGNGLIGIHIHNVKDRFGKACLKGRVPASLKNSGASIYVWDRTRFGDWIEEAAHIAEAQRDKPKSIWDFLFGV